jgi:transcriptional regulator with XRE-family HTH domain
MAIRQRGGPNHPVAKRVRLLREALFHEHCSAFGRRLGISVQRINNFENGYPLSLEVANRIRAPCPGLTLDWLYHGDERALPMDMVQRLRSSKS